MPNIRPRTDLSDKFPEIAEQCKEGKPVFLTENGGGKYVVMDMRTYEQMTARLELEQLLDEGLSSGEGRPAGEVFDELEKRFGLDAI